MKTFKKTLCVMLSIVMAFSCLTIAASAEGGETVKSSFKYYSSKSDAYNTKITLDKLDEVLKDADICEVVELGSKELEFDLRNINALCNTLDEYIGIIRLATFVGGGLLGDLKNLNLKGWEEGMQRPGDDTLILNELIDLVAVNRGLVGKICDGTIDLGVFAEFIDLKDLLGDDGVSGMLKELLLGVVYKDGTTEFNNAYNTYKNDIDAFIYGPLLSKFANDYLPGFTMNAGSTVEEVISTAFSISVDKYLINEVKKININLAGYASPSIRALSGLVNLNGSSYDLSGLKLDSSKPLLDQLNGVVGALAKQVVPSYNGWENGGYDKIDTNLKNLLAYVGIQSGLIPQASSMTLEEIVIEGVRIILSNADLGSYATDVEKCDSIEEMFTVFLRNVSYDLGVGVIYDEDDSYLVILGDMFAYWACSLFEIKDLNGKAYYPGGGKDVYEVANYFMNYFLFEKGTAGFMGLNTSKDESVFVKIDKILDYFGETKAKGVSFDSEEFQKDILDAVFSCDIDTVLELTVVPAINNAGDVSAVEFLYKSVQYYVNNWAGKTLFPAYRDKAFTNALSNESIANIVSVLLETVNSRRAAFITLATFTVGLIFEGEAVSYNVTEVDVEPCVATGTVLYPEATVKLDGKALTQGKDYVVTVNSRVPGEAKATVKFMGMYEGSVERNINIGLAAVDKVSFLSNTKTVKLVWNAVPCADGYNVLMLKNGNYEKLNTEIITGKEFYINNLVTATEYSLKVEAVRSGYGASAAKEIKVATTPATVNAATIKTLTDSSRARFVWGAVENATHYKLEKYVAGANKWEEVLITDKTDVTVSGLDGYTAYSFRISALKKTSDGNYASAAPVSVNVKTTIGAVTKVSVSYTSNSITLKWDPVTNAQVYQVLQNVGGKWQSIAVVNGTSYKATGLKVATKYQYAVRAAVKENGKWIMGGHKIVEQYTGLAKPKTFKVMATNANAAQIGWTSVANAAGYEVFQYVSGKWVSKGITKKTTVTISGLPSGTKSYFRVRAVTTVNGKYHYGDATDYVTALTLPGKVTGLKTTQRKQTSITLTWNKVTGASGYQIFRLHNGSWVSLGTTTSNKYTDTKSLKKGTDYQYRVRAVQKVGTAYKYGAASDTLKTSTPYMNITLT